MVFHRYTLDYYEFQNYLRAFLYSVSHNFPDDLPDDKRYHRKPPYYCLLFPNLHYNKVYNNRDSEPLMPPYRLPEN